MPHPTQALESSAAKLLARRHFLTYFSGLGLSSTLLPGVLWAKMQEEQVQEVTKEMISGAEQLAGLEFTDQEREYMVEGLNQNLERYQELRRSLWAEQRLAQPAVQPRSPWMSLDTERRPFKMSTPADRPHQPGRRGLLAGDRSGPADSITESPLPGFDPDVSGAA